MIPRMRNSPITQITATATIARITNSTRKASGHNPSSAQPLCQKPLLDACSFLSLHFASIVLLSSDLLIRIEEAQGNCHRKAFHRSLALNFVGLTPEYAVTFTPRK